MGERPIGIVICIEATDPVNPSVPVVDGDIADLIHPPVIIIIYGDVFNLYYRTIIVVLHIWIVVVTRVEGNSRIPYTDVGPHVNPVVQIKVELTIRVNGKGDPAFFKNKGVSI